MAKQALLWTALPNGYSEDNQSLRVSVLVSPRLDAEADPQELSSFPDFADWPKTLTDAKFVVHFGADSVAIAGNDTTSASRIDTALGGPDTSVWKALLPDTTFVRGFGFKDLSNNQVLSFPAANIDALVRNLYRGLAASAGDELPKVSDFLSNPAWSDLVTAVAQNDRRFVNHEGTMRDPQRQFSVFADGGFKNLRGTARDLALFQLFHTPPATPQTGQYAVPPGHPKSYAKWLGYKQTTLPAPADFEKEIDFHQIVAAMNQYPTLLRRLGLVVDLLIAKTEFSASPNAALSVEVVLPPGAPGVTRVPDVSARSRTLLDAKRFQPVSRPNPQPGDYRVEGRLLVLDPKVFKLVQVDGDGAGLKVMNFARTLGLMKNNQDQKRDPISQQEHEKGAPALRNAGLMLVHMDRGAMLKNNFGRQKQFNAAAELIQNGANQQPPPELYAEDLARGYRIDIWDGKTRRWRSLCQRESDYDLNNGAVTIHVSKGEGTLRLGATKTPDPASNPNLVWLHEALVSWTGWSLCARPPGRTIHHKGADHTDPVGDAEAEVPPGLRLKTAFNALKGSLPRLRYGRSYWVRARMVDLAGNSLPVNPKDFGPEKPKDNAAAYLRYEPVSAPAIALVKPTPATVEAPAEGESMERMAVRSFNDTPADNTVPSTQKARRFAVPPRTTHREAEQHGMLDDAGKVDPATFTMLTQKDASLAEEKLLLAGPLSEQPPVETGFAVMEEGQKLPYLPDPLALQVAARILGHPTFDANKIIPIPLYPAPAAWPEAAPFKIELYENPADQPRFDAATRTLFIPLPKAIRARLRLSVRPTKEALKLLGVWSWLTPGQQAALEKRALNGQHWMLTPWRTIELVHAVQRPLIAPEILKITVGRGSDDTHASPHFVATCSIKSTDHLDLLAQWNEPVEDLTQNAGANRARNDHAFAVKITDAQSYAGTPDFRLEGTDLVRAGGAFHDRVARKVHEFNDTRYRRIEYWLEATTKFREFMPANLLTEVVSGQTQPTDKHIKVTGPMVRTWIPSSAPPPVPEVLYVVPTFGWVRTSDASKKSSWRRGGGLRVYLNRPWNVSGYGEMLAVVVPSAAFTGDPNTDPTAQPLKNFVTQWGNDPIWLSPFVAGASPKPSNFPLRRTAPDPAGKWLPAFAPATEADQRAPFETTALRHPETASVNAQFLVDVAPHDVFYDSARQLWYCDIEVTWGASYYPFIRLALARYQPGSIEGAHLSKVVLADFLPLVSDRWLNVTQTNDARTKRVGVFGSTYRDSSSHVEAAHAPAMSVQVPDGSFITLEPAKVAPSSVVEVWVERLDPALGEDFGWRREPDAVVRPDVQPTRSAPMALPVSAASLRAQALQLFRQRKFDVLLKENLIGRFLITPALWEGSVTLPQAPGGDVRYRLAIAEYEEYLVDDTRPYDPVPTKKDRRLAFIEYVELT
jgi:hypothetical protein